MESQHFDWIAKHISRRGVTKGLLAGVVAGLFALLGRQLSQAQGCETACASGECADLRGQAKGECMRACTGTCGCPEGTTYCPDDGLCYDLQTNNCHCADPSVSGGSPCGGLCVSGPPPIGAQCCISGLCQGSGPSLTCPRPPLPSNPDYCTPGIRPHSA